MKKNNCELIEFYGGAAVIEKRPWQNYFSFRRQGEKKTLLSVTRIAKQVDKGDVLLNWAVGEAARSMRASVEVSPTGTFSREEVMLMIDEGARKWRDLREAGAKVGTIVHDFAHDFAKAKINKTKEPSIEHLDEDDEDHTKALNGISAFLDFYNNDKVEFLEMEKLFYYNSLLAGDTKKKEPIIEYYGFMDLLAVVNGILAVIDYKTAKGVYSEQQYQVSALRHARDKEILAKGMKTKTRELTEIEMIINFNKETGELIKHEITKEESAKNIKAFLGQHRVAERERELKR